ncbi:hypothetical protein C8R47DRAFT_221876 [Mycena vitilis]|nr:hypothetical protein C8R47DRAFT_221876 [Mycena vitilis]
MKANEVRRALAGGAADIVQRSWAMEGLLERPQERPCALYEFKRDNALLVDDQGTLTRLVELASVPGGYNFKTGAKGAQLGSNEGKILNLLSQIIDEMIEADNGHVVVTPQTQYVLVRLSASLQLEISDIYRIRDSPTQLDDMVILVLFCTLSALSQETSYPAGPEVWRVHIPQFPTWVLQPIRAFFGMARGSGRPSSASPASHPSYHCPGSVSRVKCCQLPTTSASPVVNCSVLPRCPRRCKNRPRRPSGKCFSAG